MKIIVGLGNPGEKYKLNRHNVGFLFINYLLVALNMKAEAGRFELNSANFRHDKYLLSDVARLSATAKFPELLFAKPQTFMNKSGDAVAACVTRFALHDTRNELIVIHDDLDIPFGKFKIQMQGPKAHNGLTDIQNKIRSMDFLRVRIGVDSRPAENRMNGEEFVLQNFTEQERSILPELFKKIELRFIPFLQSVGVLQTE